MLAMGGRGANLFRKILRMVLVNTNGLRLYGHLSAATEPLGIRKRRIGARRKRTKNTGIGQHLPVGSLNSGSRQGLAEGRIAAELKAATRLEVGLR